MQCLSCDTSLPSEATTCPSCGASPASSLAIEPSASHLDTNPYKAYVPFVDGQVMMKSSTPSSQNSTTTSTHPSTSSVQEEHDAPPEPVRRRGLLVTNIVLLCILILLIVGEGSGFLSAEASFRSNVLPAQATDVARNLLATQAQNTAIANTQATATATAMTPQQIYTWATSGTPVIDDPLDNPENTSWFESTTKEGSCTIQDGAYHMSISEPGSSICFAPGSFFHDLAFQIQITILKGDSGGVFLRSQNSTNYYLCYLNSDGSYVFSILKDSQQQVLKSDIDSKLVANPRLPHLLTVVARGSTTYLYIDKSFMVQIMDTTYSAGQVGLLASSATGQTDVAFQNVKVWGL